MRFISLFSGIEAASVAWLPLGNECAAVAEIDKFPSTVLAHHYPGVPNLGNVCGITRDRLIEIGPVNAVVFGFPCQDLSIAGKRAGLKGARSGLFFEAMRIIEICRELWRTRWTIVENVPGLFSSKHGTDFATVVGTMVGAEFTVPKGRWQNTGVALGPLGLVEWAVLDAQWFGVPQRRRRVFLVRDSGDWRSRPPVLSFPESLQGHTPPSRKAGKVAPTIPARRLGGGGLGSDFDCDGGLVAGPLGAGEGNRGWRNDLDQGAFIPSTVACLDASYGRLQGCSEQDANHGHSHLVAFGGNNTSGPIDIATACNAHGGSGRMDFETETLITAPLAQNPYADNKSRESLLVTHSLRADGFDASEDGTGRDTPLAPVTAETLRSGSSNPASHGKTNGTDRATLIAVNLRGRDGGAMPECADVASIRAASGGSSRSYIAQQAVRRLTPRECERLQGFPDDYTKISDKTADGPRYKALGNSFAVPVVRWIGKRIQLASLFS